MSRSTRRPYSSICGTGSANQDKTTARRNVRRKQNQWLKTLTDYDSALAPHKYECSGNDVCAWGRDGSQFLSSPTDYDWEMHQECLQGLWEGTIYAAEYATWPPQWFLRRKRK